MAHAERTCIPAPADTPIASLDVADIRRELQTSTLRFRREVTDRFGVLPSFFCSAEAAPGLAEELWKFAKSAYLDSPLPSLFKERLFVHLSRFCEVRYCIIRHVGFLIGQGRPAGDADAASETVDQVIEMLRRPLPEGPAFTEVLSVSSVCPLTVGCRSLAVSARPTSSTR
jgi:hypothetical protein